MHKHQIETAKQLEITARRICDALSSINSPLLADARAIEDVIFYLRHWAQWDTHADSNDRDFIDNLTRILDRG